LAASFRDNLYEAPHSQILSFIAHRQFDWMRVRTPKGNDPRSPRFHY
jgi:hypothetical protein